MDSLSLFSHQTTTVKTDCLEQYLLLEKDDIDHYEINGRSLGIINNLDFINTFNIQPLPLMQKG